MDRNIKLDFLENCDEINLNLFSNDIWSMLLMFRIELNTHIRNLLTSDSFLINMLKSNPDFIQYCNFNKFNSHNIIRLIVDVPQFAKYCNLSKLNGNFWSFLLKIHPQLSVYCDWSKLDDDNWKKVLEYQPHLKIYKNY